MYWNFDAIDGVIKNQINTQQDATLEGNNVDSHWQLRTRDIPKVSDDGVWRLTL
jgi:hypothetical protein